MRPAFLFRGVVTAGGLIGAGSAWAQELPDPVFAAQDMLRRSGNIDPLDVEPRPELQALGVRLGNYTLRASADVAPMLNSNVRVRPDSDFGVAGFIAPRVQISSNGEREPLSAFVAGSLTAYPAQSTETVGTLTGGIDVTKELSQTVIVQAQAEGGRYFEDRVLSFTPNLSYRPVKFDRVHGSVAATINTARLIVTPSFDVDRLAYHDGLRASNPTVTLVQRTRTFTRVEPGLVVGYAVSNTTAVYVGGAYNTRRYDINTRLDSEGYAAYAGIRLRPTSITRLDVALGYQRQYYGPGFTDPKGIYVRVSGLYSPDRATTVELNYRRDISETGGVEVGGLTRDRIGASIRRNVLRNVTVSGSAELRRYDFASIQRRDQRWFINADARYVVSRQLELFVRGEQMFSHSGGAASSLFDFNRTTVLSGVTLKL